jgi:hypothetical protein
VELYGEFLDLKLFFKVAKESAAGTLVLPAAIIATWSRWHRTGRAHPPRCSSAVEELIKRRTPGLVWPWARGRDAWSRDSLGWTLRVFNHGDVFFLSWHWQMEEAIE